MTREAGEVDYAKAIALTRGPPTKKKMLQKNDDAPEIKYSQDLAQIQESDETRETPQTEMNDYPTTIFPARQRSVSPIAIDRIQSLQWESNKVEKVIRK